MTEVFRNLDRTMSTYIFSFLTLKDLCKVSRVCTSFHSMAQEGYLWRAIFSRQYPHSDLKASRMADWRYVFELETRQILDGLRCFHTKRQ